MLFKLFLKIGILAIEIFLAFYSLIITDSLLVKFLFFAFTSVIIAFVVTRVTNHLLPQDKDHVSDSTIYTEMESHDYKQEKIAEIEKIAE